MRKRSPLYLRSTMNSPIRAYLKLFVALTLASVYVVYSIFNSDFAELYVKLPFLNFPVFIGECVLLGSGLCLAIAFCHKRFLSNKWFWFFAGYGIWILIKALTGYQEYGPLAFRHSAMFYYAIFAVFAYLTWSSFKRTPWLPGGMFTISLVLFFKLPNVIQSFSPAYFIICCICLLYFKQKRWRFFGIFILLLAVPFKNFFQGGSAFILGNSAGFLILLAGCFWAYKGLRRTTKVLLTIGAFLGVGVVAFLLAPRSEINTFLKPDFIIQSFLEKDAFIQRRRKSFEYKKIVPHLYNDNRKCYAERRRVSEIIKLKRRANRKNKMEDAGGFWGSPILSNWMILRLTGGIYSGRAGHKGDILRNPLASSWMIFELSRLYHLEKKEGVFNKQLAQVEVKKNKNVHRAVLRDVHPKEQIDEEGNFEKQLMSDEMMLVVGKRFDLIGKKIKEGKSASPGKQEKDSDVQGAAFSNVHFRLFIWRDMIEQLLSTENMLTGMPFGRPLRSSSIEILGQANGEWTRDGWIEPHNSFLNMIYRGGVVGILIVGAMVFYLMRMFIFFIAKESYHGIFLIAVLVFWNVIACFSVTYELPYWAIPIWIWWGVTYEYYTSLKRRRVSLRDDTRHRMPKIKIGKSTK